MSTTNIVQFPANHRQEPISHDDDTHDGMPVSDRALNQALLLEMLGTKPLSIHRIYVKITGGVLPALWLSNAVRRANAEAVTDSRQFRFTMSARECEEETGLTRSQQNTCRKRLTELRLLTEERGPGRLSCYWLQLGELRRQTLEQVRPLAASIEQRMRRSA